MKTVTKREIKAGILGWAPMDGVRSPLSKKVIRVAAARVST